MQQKQKDIERQKKREAALRAKMEQEKAEAEKREREQAIGALQNQASLQLQASGIQQRRVSAAIEVLRIFSTTTGYPRAVSGINPVGRGMAGLGRHGQVLRDYRGVERSGITVWCDCCRVPIGQSVSYVCYSCDARICMGCYRLGRGCLDRSHLLIEDHYWRRRQVSSSCPRVRQPGMALWCANAWCRKPIGGLYLHCCCMEIDFCEACILSRNVQCGDNRHLLFWGVRPLPLDLSSNATDLVSQGLKYPQKIVQVSEQTTQTWLDTSTRPLALSTSVLKQKNIRHQQECLLEALQDGDVTISLKMSISFCDFCFAPVQTKPHYGCNGSHPETGLADTNIALCQPCYMRGIRCPSYHSMSFYAATQASCDRDISPPFTLQCDACKKAMVQELYFHCCQHDDDLDICVDCVLDGWTCPNETGDHVLRMFYLTDG